jgi:hypothetical protein
MSQVVLDQLLKAKKIGPQAEWDFRLTIPTGTIIQKPLDPDYYSLNIGVPFEICGHCFTIYAKRIELMALPVPGSQPRIVLPKKG